MDAHARRPGGGVELALRRGRELRELKRPRRVRAGRRPTVYGGPCTVWLAQRAGGRGLHMVDGRGTGALSPGGWAAVGERVSLQIVV